MILFSLLCDDAHSFDCWFASNAAFDDQVARGLVSCPACGSSSVRKAIMAPAVPKVREAWEAPESFAADLRRRAMSSRDVGPRFAEVARRMHDGDLPREEVRGTATPDEVRSLREDGVGFLPVPPAPTDMN